MAQIRRPFKPTAQMADWQKCVMPNTKVNTDPNSLPVSELTETTVTSLDTNLAALLPYLRADWIKKIK